MADLAATGKDMHGEATFVEALGVRSVLDAGCGTGRVAIELARRGLEVVGVDADPGMLSAARAKAPDVEWILADLSDFELPDADGPGPRRFDAVVLAGNVMIFVVPGTLASRAEPDGRVDAGTCRCPARIRPPAVSGRDPHISRLPAHLVRRVEPVPPRRRSPYSPGRRGREADTTPELRWSAVVPRWGRAL